MKERPILFSGPMVRAILEGRKTQTRRIIKQANMHEGLPDSQDTPVWASAVHPARDSGWIAWWPDDPGRKFTSQNYAIGFSCPYGKPGDRLWVRETFWNGTSCYTSPCGEAVGYWTDKIQYMEERSKEGPWSESYTSSTPWMKKRPSIHMPRWASRITLEVTGVRVERLQNISEADAVSEGIEHILDVCGRPLFYPTFGTVGEGSARDSFHCLWQSINGAGSWESNPWVWVVEFKRIEQTPESHHRFAQAVNAMKQEVQS